IFSILCSMRLYTACNFFSISSFLTNVMLETGTLSISAIKLAKKSICPSISSKYEFILFVSLLIFLNNFFCAVILMLLLIVILVLHLFFFLFHFLVYIDIYIFLYIFKSI